ncbi:DUF4957 domain-containing protein [uncultured Alistipes sp.]|uniref:DUF5123 domain-containing protein n=1 Tax=uncultured Alistipes sp. TaxID=538949 RepID=UPI0025E55C88|nr:DUF4957 domain-containing protein [uncultured Alistipes sp.]
MKSIFRKLMSGLLLFSVAGLGGCSDDPDGINNELVLDRALTPLNFTASVLSTGNQVRLTWDVRTTDTYEVVIYSDEGLTTVVETKSDLTPADVPVTFDLVAENEYYATVQAFSQNERTAPSHVAVAGPIVTYAIMDPLNPVVTERTSNSVTLKWDQDQYVTHLLATPVASADQEPVRLDLSDEQVQAATATIGDLQPSTEYFVAVFYNSASRGGQDVWTRPDMQNMTKISTIEQLMQAFVDGGKYQLAYSETPYTVPSYGEGETNPASALAADLTIIGETTLEGAKPAIVGLGIGLNPGVNDIRLEDLSLDGADAASSLMEVKDAIAMNSVTVKNCDLAGYRNIFYENKAGSAIQTLLFDGLYAANMGNSGGDFIDFRTESTHGTLTITNSTFYNGARSFLRVDAKETLSSIVIRNNTFSNFSTVTDGNNKGFFYVRGTAAVMEYANNLFLNETGENARFIANNSSVQLPTLIQNNYFYNCADTFFEAKISDGVEITQSTATQNGGKILTEDPCENSLRGKFYLVNDEIASARIGDPRWWNAVAPIVPEQTELNVITEATVWNFADTENFEPQEILSTKILGNLQFIVNDEEAPMAVTDKGTISFSAASTLSVLDVPTNNALAFKVSVPGSVLITPGDAGYNKHMEIIVNGTRYAVPADGKQSKFGFGDIQGETTVYICSCAPVELQALEWSLEVVSGGEPKALDTPVFTTTDIPAVDQGTSQPIAVVWNAVPNAAAYEVTFNGKTETVETPSYEIPASTVASLKAGQHTLSVVAKAAEGSLNWLDSEAASVTITIKGVLTTVSSAYTWNIADASSFPAGDIKETSVFGNLQFLASDSKHMTIEHSIGDQGEPVDRIKFNDKSTLEDVTPTLRALALRVSGNGTLTVKAISSSSSDATREVGVSANGKEYLREACPTSSDGEAKTVKFTDLSGETTIYIYCYATINVYGLSWEPDNSGVQTQPYNVELSYDLIKNHVGDEIQILTGTEMDGTASEDAMTKFSTSSSKPYIQTWTYQGITFGSAMAASSSSMYIKKGLAIETYLKNDSSLGAISTIYLKIVDGSKVPTVSTSDNGTDFTALEIPTVAEGEGTYAGYYRYDTAGKPYFKITIGGGDAKITNAVIVGEK